ncbi:hypothetical protein ESCO_001169 [Escovopsis weberi]|uniref:Uncharacterized protein n=1 Tax=Escovopsis weberi TaxID=150374 RepID=A0A0M8N4F9_ESCWE|nr:hypothetical protein ESCO_001169 [Escovopsis weberi]
MCFPETMLLSSSLTIETIRSYSKKVRQPGAERLSMAAAPQFTFSAGPAGPVMPIESTSPCAGTKSRWRRVVRRASPCSKKKRESRFWESSAEPPSATAFEAPKPWLSLKNVFGNCSDYICDALYAHIVAYNYVSALVARNPPPNPSNSRRSCSSGPSDNEDIPKKAATLLGFGQSAGAALIGVASRTGKKPRPSSKTSGVSSNDAALRAIKCGLQRCIRQLITTARLMAEEDSGEGEDRPLEMETQDNDRLLMRSLCEIVRISEGAAYGC